MHTRSRHQGWKPQKWTGKGLVHSPAAVTIHEKTTKRQDHTKSNKNKTKNKLPAGRRSAKEREEDRGEH
jgi:hypothetical protein